MLYSEKEYDIVSNPWREAIEEIDEDGNTVFRIRFQSLEGGY